MAKLKLSACYAYSLINTQSTEWILQTVRWKAGCWYLSPDIFLHDSGKMSFVLQNIALQVQHWGVLASIAIDPNFYPWDKSKQRFEFIALLSVHETVSTWENGHVQSIPLV